MDSVKLSVFKPMRSEHAQPVAVLLASISIMKTFSRRSRCSIINLAAALRWLDLFLIREQCDRATLHV